MNENIDDGSLAFLKIKREDGTKHFKVNEITQAQLANAINLLKKYSYDSKL